MNEPNFASLSQAAAARARAALRVEEISALIFQLKRQDPKPRDFETRRRTLNGDLRRVQNEISVIDAWIEDHRTRTQNSAISTKRAAIEANLRQSENARARDAEKTLRHNEEREEKMRLLVGLLRAATPVLARSEDPEASNVIDEVRTKAPWLLREAS